MWIFTSFGFFSVVANRKKGKEQQVVVRARFEGDLDRLRKEYIPRLSGVTFKKYADYPYRAYCGRQAFANGMQKICMDLFYTNFKSEVGKVQGFKRESLYMDVWSTMRRGEEVRRWDTFLGHYGYSGGSATLFGATNGVSPTPLVPGRPHPDDPYERYASLDDWDDAEFARFLRRTPVPKERDTEPVGATDPLESKAEETPRRMRQLTIHERTALGRTR